MKNSQKSPDEEHEYEFIDNYIRMKKDRVYMLGKSQLFVFLPTYNKSDEHEVVYHAEKTMNLVENMSFQLLDEYREQANRERFILPEAEEISFFSNAIKKSVEFFGK
jgi:hypothetical protein